MWSILGLLLRGGADGGAVNELRVKNKKVNDLYPLLRELHLFCDWVELLSAILLSHVYPSCPRDVTGVATWRNITEIAFLEDQQMNL